MKSTTQILILTMILMFTSAVRLFGQGQACITFHSDYSGLEWDAAERARSTTAACSLRTLIADAGVSGFMSHSCQLSLNDTFEINGIQYSWHHLEDGKTLVPVVFDIHSKWKHTGGRSIIDNGLRGFF